MFSIDEVEDFKRGEERPAAISSRASIMSIETENAVGGGGENDEGREDSGRMETPTCYHRDQRRQYFSGHQDSLEHSES